jgi:hypothetical protein
VWRLRSSFANDTSTPPLRSDIAHNWYSPVPKPLNQPLCVTYIEIGNPDHNCPISAEAKHPEHHGLALPSGFTLDTQGQTPYSRRSKKEVLIVSASPKTEERESTDSALLTGITPCRGNYLYENRPGTHLIDVQFEAQCLMK